MRGLLRLITSFFPEIEILGNEPTRDTEQGTDNVREDVDGIPK